MGFLYAAYISAAPHVMALKEPSFPPDSSSSSSSSPPLFPLP